MQDPDVDVVYIATTHPGHYEQALLAIAAGKAVLIEKPVCLNADQARTVFQAAEAAGVFAMEAMWMRTNPLIRTAQKLIADGVIGEVRSVRAEIGLGLPFDPTHRLYDLANGGGALLDLGIYPATFAWIFLGKPDDVIVHRQRGASRRGRHGGHAVGLRRRPGRPAVVLGIDARALPRPDRQGEQPAGSPSEGRFHRPSGLTVTTRDGQTSRRRPVAGSGVRGYLPEIDEVERCLRAGALTSPLVPPAETDPDLGSSR